MELNHYLPHKETTKKIKWLTIRGKIKSIIDRRDDNPINKDDHHSLTNFCKCVGTLSDNEEEKYDKLEIDSTAGKYCNTWVKEAAETKGLKDKKNLSINYTAKFFKINRHKNAC